MRSRGPLVPAIEESGHYVGLWRLLVIQCWNTYPAESNEESLQVMESNKGRLLDRYALFLPSLRAGGAERVMVNLAHGLSSLGLAVDVLVSAAEGPYTSDLPPGVRVVDLEAGRVGRSLPKLVPYLRRERPRALLSAMNHANVVALLARELARVPVRVVVSVHGTVSGTNLNRASRSVAWVRYGMRLLYPRADCIIAVSRGLAHDVAKMSGVPDDRIKVVYNPIVSPELLKKAEEPLNHPWFAKGEPPVILGVGRLSQEKGFPALLHAFARVRRARSARLMILGEGGERSRLEILVRQLGLESDVDLPGFVQNPYNFMKHAAVFVSASESEGFGNVLVEAMAVGTPVVATDCPSGPAEILEGGCWGRLVPVGDIAALADGIEEALTDHSHCSSVVRAMDFTVDRMTAEYARVLGV